MVKFPLIFKYLPITLKYPGAQRENRMIPHRGMFKPLRSHLATSLFLSTLCLLGGIKICRGEEDARQKAINRISKYYVIKKEDGVIPVKANEEAEVSKEDENYTYTFNKMIEGLKPNENGGGGSAEKDFNKLIGWVYDLLQPDKDKYKILQNTLQAKFSPEEQGSLQEMNKAVEELTKAVPSLTEMAEQPDFKRFVEDMLEKHDALPILKYSNKDEVSVEATGKTTGKDNKDHPRTTWTYLPKGGERSDGKGGAERYPIVKARWEDGDKGYVNSFFYNDKGHWRRVLNEHVGDKKLARNPDRAVPRVADKEHEPLKAPPSIDLKSLKDGIGYEGENATFQKVKGGGYFFFGNNPPKADGQPTYPQSAKVEWAYYDKEGRFVAYWNQLKLSGSQGSATNQDVKINSRIKEGAKIIRSDLSSKENLENLKIPLLNNGQEKSVQALRLRDGAFIDVKDGTEYRKYKHADGSPYYVSIRHSKPSSVPPTPGVQPSSGGEEEEGGTGNGPNGGSSPTLPPTTVSPSPTANPAAPTSPAAGKPSSPSTPKSEIEGWQNFLNGLEPSKYKEEAARRLGGEPGQRFELDSLLRTMEDSGVDSVVRKKLFQFAVEAAKARPDYGDRISRSLEQVLRNGASDEEVLREAAKAIYKWNNWKTLILRKPDMVGDKPYNGLNYRLERLLTSQNVPTASRVVALKELAERLSDSAYLEKHERFLNILSGLIKDKNQEISQAAIQQLKLLSKGYILRIPEQTKIRENIMANLETKALNFKPGNPSEKNEALEALVSLLKPQDKKMIFDLVYCSRIGFSPTDTDEDKLLPVSEELRKEIEGALPVNSRISVTVHNVKESLKLNLGGGESKAKYKRMYKDFEDNNPQSSWDYFLKIFTLF